MAEPSTNSALIARILDGARWATLLRLSAQVVSWLSTLVVVRYISATDYGLNAMLETSLDLLLLVSTLGLDLALVRAKVLTPEVVRPVFGLLLIVNLALFSIYFFGSPLIAAYFGEPRLELLAKALAFVFVLNPLRVIPNAMLDRELKFKLRAGVEMVCSVVAALTALTLAMLGYGVWALVSGVLVNRTLAALLLMQLQPWIALPSFRLKPIRGLLAEGGPLVGASALAMTASMFPVLIGGPALGPAELGLYAVASQFAMLPLSKVMPIVNSVAFPAFSKFQGQPVAVGGFVATCLGTGALVLLPLMVGLACASEAFTRGLLGEQWRDAALPLALVSLAMPLRGVALFLRQVVIGVGRADLVLRCNAVIWVAGLFLVSAGVEFGLAGLVAAFISIEVIGCILTLWLASTAMELAWSAWLAAFRAPVIATTLMAALVFAVGSGVKPLAPPIVVLMVQVASGAIVYALILRALFWSEVRTRIAAVLPQ